MATITIKIESEDLARKVLANLGYLPEISDLVEVTPIEECRAPKTHDVSMPKPTRKMPDTPKQNEFCVTEDRKPEVEPVESELGAPLEVYSEESKKEREEIYKQSLEVRKSLPSAEDRLKAQVDELLGADILDHLDALADHPDKEMRESVKAYVLREYTGHNLARWPALHKITWS